EPSQLRAQERPIRDPGEEVLERVERDARGSYGLDRVRQAREETVEAVGTRLERLGRVHADVLDRELLLRDQLVEVEPEGRGVPRELLGRLLEGEEDAGLVVKRGAANEELDREDGLAGARAAAHERRPSPGETSAGDLVQA